MRGRRACFLTRRAHGFPRADDQRLRTLRNVDVNERHAFVCEEDVVHVFSRESGSETLRILADATVRCSQRVEDPTQARIWGLAYSITSLSLSPPK